MHKFVLLVLFCGLGSAWGWCRRDGPTDGPCVDLISPTSGSLAGGQLVSIKGTNLLPESPDPLIPAAVVTIGGVPCVVQRVMSSSEKLVCKTGATTSSTSLDGVASWHPGWRGRGCEQKETDVSVKVLGVGGIITHRWNAGSGGCLGPWAHHRCKFSYAWLATPSVMSVSPRTASPGDMVTVTGKTCAADFVDEVSGRRLEPALKRFERVLIGEYFCELSTPTCDTTTTKQCPTMYTANLTDRRYRKNGWYCEVGTFECRLPATLPLGKHNVSFRIPSEKGQSLLTAYAMTPGIKPAEAAAALEVIPKVQSVVTDPDDTDLLMLSVSGLGVTHADNVSLHLSPISGPGRIACPVVSLSAGSVACNRTLGEQTWLDETSWPPSCLAILNSDPQASSGFYTASSRQTR